MNKVENFILEYSNFVPQNYCEQVIEYFNTMDKAGFCSKRTDYIEKHHVDDKQIALHEEKNVRFSNSGDLTNAFIEHFWKEAYPHYEQKYSILGESEEHKIYHLKIQKTLIGEGYHRWHNETVSKATSVRMLTFILYLNDVEEGGETEFLYYPKRIKAETGKLVLFPGYFTHTHRGNPPISNTKYIVTGWVEY